MDRLGTKIGFAAGPRSSGAWPRWRTRKRQRSGPTPRRCSALVGLAYLPSVAGFIAVRFALGLGESGSFPASIKTVAEWFPKRERALATGIFNSGTNVGALLVPLVVPWITLSFGWYWAFIATGLLGFLWLFLWLPIYNSPDRHPRVTPAELAHIRSDPPEPTMKVPLMKVLPHPQAWGFAIAKFLTDPVWWLYLFWIPDFLNRNYGVDLKGMMLPVFVIYSVATVGSIGGGWLSGALLRPRAGASTRRARPPCSSARWRSCRSSSRPGPATCGWRWRSSASRPPRTRVGRRTSSRIASDTFPKQAVGTVVGFGGMAGAVGGMLIAKLTGYILQWTGSYVPVFLIAGFAYLVALGIVQLLMPRLAPARLTLEDPR